MERQLLLKQSEMELFDTSKVEGLAFGRAGGYHSTLGPLALNLDKILIKKRPPDYQIETAVRLASTERRRILFTVPQSTE